MMRSVMSAFFFGAMIACLVAAPICYAQQNCSDYRFPNNRTFSACNALPVLSSFIHWTYHASNHTADIAYRHAAVTSSDYVVWSLNPGRGRMVGAQCLVAFQNSSGLVHAYTSPVTSYDTAMKPAPLSFRVHGLTAEFSPGENQMTIFATLELPSGSTSFTQVWQHGGVAGDVPLEHRTSGPNMRSYNTIDFATGLTSSSGAGSASGLNKKSIHGMLNVASWGIMMPLGVMSARYLKVFKSANPAWFYIHVTCQASAYIVGVAGWATGLGIGGDSNGPEQTTHGNIGMTLFIFGTLQVFALLLRPKPDHKYRFYWNIYHHSVGYSVIVLSIVNIFQGLDLLDPDQMWKTAWVGAIALLGVVAVILEGSTWLVVLRRRRKQSQSSRKYPQHILGSNGMNGVGGLDRMVEL